VAHEPSSNQNGCRSCSNHSVKFFCARCNGRFCDGCIQTFGEKAARMLVERVYGKGTIIGSAKIFDDQGRAFCPECYGKLLDHSVKTGQWVIQSPEEAEPSVMRIDAPAGVSAAESAGEPEYNIAAPGATLEQKLEATRKLLDAMPHLLDVRQEMALARQSLAEAQMRILLEPKGYGLASEYRENCKAIMKSSKEVKRVAKEMRNAYRKLGQDEPPSISEALQKAAEAEGQFTFWERIRSSFG
jgi:hypothetical protein